MARPSQSALTSWTVLLLALAGVCAGAAWWLEGLAAHWLCTGALAAMAGALAVQRQQLQGMRTQLAQAAQAAQHAEQTQLVLLAAQQEALRANTLLERVIEALPVGIEIYDEEQRLVVFNQKLSDLYPDVGYATQIGKRFEAVLRDAMARKIVPAAWGREEEWVAQRVAEHGRRGEVILPLLSGERWMRIHETRTPEGIVVVTRMEITDLIRQQEALEAAQAEAQRARQMLTSCLEALDIGVEIYDAQDRLVLYNQKLNQMHPGFFDPSDLGQTFEALVRDTLRLGLIADAAGREEAWLAERLAARDTRRGPLLQQMRGDLWIQTYETRTPEGYTVTGRVDVTELVRKEHQLAGANQQLEKARLDVLHNRQLLEAALEAMPIGIEIFDEQDRMVLRNQVLGTLVPLPDDGSEIGQTFQSIVRRNLAAGRVPDALGREEEWLRERMATRGRQNGPLLQRTGEDSWINTYETITPAGYTVTARADVSDLMRKEHELAAANELLAELSATDGLTGIANRRRFDEALNHEWLRSTRGGTSLSLLLIDIDHFKAYNDHYGHLAGDECLRCVAQILTDCLRRAGELVARYGGEEFALLLPGTELEHAQAVALRCNDKLREAAIDHDNSDTAPHLTLSIGVATITPLPTQKPEMLINAADTALYQAKHAGRNRCVVAAALA